MMTKRTIHATPRSDDLLHWYDQHGRSLPWRQPPLDPYAIWISEIMLQQTTVTAVIPYYKAFMQRWPTLHDLAQADLSDVLHAWQGLGYYRRAHQLYKCCHVLVDQHSGLFPRTSAELKTLPGIGPYTAAAIASIAFNEPVAAVDGNVLRVMARVFALAEPKTKLAGPVTARTQAIVPNKRAGDFTQALMELGSQICTPKNPSCSECPWSHACQARILGQVDLFPSPTPRKIRPVHRGYVYWVYDDATQQTLFEKRPESGLLSGTWQLPTSAWEGQPQHLPWLRISSASHGEVHHTFTHFDLVLELYPAEILDQPHSDVSRRWCQEHDIPTLAISSLMKKVLRQRALDDALKPAGSS